MRYGIHLPHAGEQATPALLRRFAVKAEELGLDDVWVSEHIIVPRDQFPRSPLFYDPVLTLTWVAAVTRRVRLGTSVLVLPMRHPLPLAKELATLHNLSEGRLILGAGVGWLKPEFAALGVPFAERGRRLDEGLAMMRAVWTQDPVTFQSRYIPAVIEGMTMTRCRSVRSRSGWVAAPTPRCDARYEWRTAGTAPATRRRRPLQSCGCYARPGLRPSSRFQCACSGMVWISALCALRSMVLPRPAFSTS